MGQHAERFFGRRAEEILGKTPAEALPAGLDAAFNDLFQHPRPSGMTLSHTAGEPITDTWLETRCLPRRNSQGRSLG